MPANAFALSDKTYNKPDRNTFPLSHSVNFTTKFGDIMPVFCKPVYSGDSFRIRPAFALQFMPTIFPIQSRVRAKLSFFYVRKRNLWKDYKDFYGKTKQNLVPPYIKCTDGQMNKMFRLGQLADSFGIPVTAYGSFPSIAQKVSLNYKGDFVAGTTKDSRFLQSVVIWNNLFAPNSTDTIGTSFGAAVGQTTDLNRVQSIVESSQSVIFYGWYTEKVLDFSSAASKTNITWKVSRILANNGQVITTNLYYVGYDANDNAVVSGVSGYDTTNQCYTPQTSDSLSSWQKVKRIFFLNTFATTNISEGNVAVLNDLLVTFTPNYTPKNGNVSIVDYPNANPYGDGENQERLSAMPFRAYEQIYNVFYRNSKNNPLIINGTPEYNEICRTIDGGADTLTYEVKKHNWELDFLTSAVQSPQQGVAPLVGITATGSMTFQDAEGNIYRAQADLDDDGTIKGFKIGETGLPQGTLRALVDTVSSGISINDLRNVNSFQRWLETNMRRGLRYVDQVKSHFGVEVDYNAMEYPEFIGGFSRDVDFNAILNQTSGAAPLGEMGGLGRCFGQSNHNITKFVPENGYIIGLLTVIPIPSYSQILPKHFLLNSVFDEYFPEFGKIGMQPILMSEVAPIQQYIEDKTQMNKVFGYQRPWYDLLGAIDEVHGEYRTTLRDYLINRVFDKAPELGEEFLLVDDSQVNDIFAVTENDHSKILGQISFNVDAKRPIPLFGVPSLE